MKISVIIPVYNVVAYLRACLKSLFAQADENIEIICVDDGSTDGSAAILDEVKVRGEGERWKFRVIHQKNAGVSAARNAALAVATGDWIGFVDADDQVDGRWFAVLRELVRKTPDAEIVYMGMPRSVHDPLSPPTDLKSVPWYCLSLEETKRLAADWKDGNVRVLEGEAARKWASGHYARYGWPFVSFVRRDFLGTLRFDETLHFKEDVAFFVQLGVRLGKIVVADFPGYYYTRRVGSAVGRPRTDEMSLPFTRQMFGLVARAREAGDPQAALLRQVVGTAVGYDFVQWAEERTEVPRYVGRTCPIRAAWRAAFRQHLVDLGDLPFFWRPGIYWWAWTGQRWVAKAIRFVRMRVHL